jgi:type VI secretion system protein ImpB
MAKESTQKKVGRVRPPRVQIQYELYIGDAMQLKELPFVVGVMGDFTGKPDAESPLPPLGKRKFVNIDRDNFNNVLASSKPRVAFRVDDKISGKADSQLAVELKFNSIEDFEPERVVRQVEPMRKLLETREKLTTLLAKMDGNDNLTEKLDDILKNTDLRQKLADQRGLSGDAEKPA